MDIPDHSRPSYTLPRIRTHSTYCPTLGYTATYSAIFDILGHNRIYLVIPCHTSIILGHSRSYRTIICHGKPYRTISVHAWPYWLIHNHTKRNKLIFGHTIPYSVTLGHNWPHGAITHRTESHLVIPMDRQAIPSFTQTYSLEAHRYTFAHIRRYRDILWHRSLYSVMIRNNWP